MGAVEGLLEAIVVDGAALVEEAAGVSEVVANAVCVGGVVEGLHEAIVDGDAQVVSEAAMVKVGEVVAGGDEGRKAIVCDCAKLVEEAAGIKVDGAVGAIDV